MADAPLVAAPPPELQVIDWLLTGASEQQIREALSQTYPGTDTRQVMQQVQEHLTAAGNPNPDAVRGWALLAYRRLYQQMLSVGDFDGARKIVREITLLGAQG